MTLVMKDKVDEFLADWRPEYLAMQPDMRTELLELLRAAQEEAWERTHICGYVHQSAHQEFCYCPYRKDES